MEYSPSFAKIVEAFMKSDSGYFTDTLTNVPPFETITLSIPTGLTTIDGGILINKSTPPFSGGAILFDTDDTHSTGISQEGFRSTPVDGDCTVENSFGTHIRCPKAWASGSDIKIQLENMDANPHTVVANLLYQVFGT